MSYRGVGGAAAALGFGLDVPYTTPGGAELTATAGTGTNCGEVAAMQSMLSALGYYPGSITGQLDESTRAALVAFGLSRGILYNPTQVPEGQICGALMEAYQAQTAPPPPGSECPAGEIGIVPYCVTIPAQTPAAPPPGAAACPPGTIGIPPNCFGLPTTPGGQLPAPGQEPPGEPPERLGWWAERSGFEKAAILGGGTLLLLALAGGMGARRRRAPMRANPYHKNRRARVKARKRKKVRRRPKLRPTGKIILVGKGKQKRRFGHRIPPKKYRRMGAVRKAQYAWPEGYMYPVHDASHCRAAITRFQRFKGDYPMHVRRTIATNLNKCIRKFKIESKGVKP